MISPLISIDFPNKFALRSRRRAFDTRVITERDLLIGSLSETSAIQCPNNIANLSQSSFFSDKP